MDSNYLKENIAYLRKASNLKQSEMQDSLKIKRNTWSNWENGISEPNIDNILRIAHFFDVSLSELLAENLEAEGKVIEKPMEGKIAKKGKVKGKVMGKVTPEDDQNLDGLEGTSGSEQALREVIQAHKQTIESQAQTIKTLQAFNDSLSAELARIKEENERIKREVPQIGKGMEDSGKQSGQKKSAWVEAELKSIEPRVNIWFFSIGYGQLTKTRNSGAFCALFIFSLSSLFYII